MKRVQETIAPFSTELQLIYLNGRYERLMAQKPITCSVEQFCNKTEMIFQKYPKSMQHSILKKMTREMTLQDKQEHVTNNIQPMTRRWRTQPHDNLVDFLSDRQSLLKIKPII